MYYISTRNVGTDQSAAASSQQPAASSTPHGGTDFSSTIGIGSLVHRPHTASSVLASTYFYNKDIR